MAAPHVAGVAALIKSMNQSLTPAEIKKIILDTVDAKASLNGKVLTGEDSMLIKPQRHGIPLP